MSRLTRISRPRTSLIYVLLLVLSSVAFGLAAHNMHGSEIQAVEILCEAKLLTTDLDNPRTVAESG